VSILISKTDTQKFLIEAQKCVLVCANCHRHIHNNRG
jgi:predicted HNH restriction endonuclease